MAIQNSKQDWCIGSVVKVGFLTLRVLAVRAVKDGLPDIYTLCNSNGSKVYEFIPHHGLALINDKEMLVKARLFVAA